MSPISTSRTVEHSRHAEESPHEPSVIDAIVRGILIGFALVLPFLYDPSVLDVAEDIRRAATLICAGTAAGLLLTRAAFRPAGAGGSLVPLNVILAVLFLLVAVVATALNEHPARALQPLKQVTTCLMLGVVTAAVWTEPFSRRMVWALCLPLPFLTLLAAVQSYELTAEKMTAVLPGGLGWISSPSQWLLDYFQQVSPPATTFANKNLAASWAGTLLPLLVGLLLAPQSSLKRLGLVGLLTAGLILVWLLRSRATLLSLMLSTVVFILLVLATRTAPIRRARIPRPVIVILSLFLVLAGSILVITIFAVDSKDAVNRASSDLTRWAYTLNGLVMLRDHALSGIGLGGFYYEYPLYHDAWIATPRTGFDVTLRPYQAHNDFLHMLIELGFPGGLLFAAVFATAIIQSLRIGVSCRDYRALSMGIALLTLALNAVLDFPLQFPTAAALAAILIGGITKEFAHRSVTSGFSFRGLHARPWMRFSILFALVVSFAVVLTEDWKSRQANVLLKTATLRMIAGGSDDETLRLVDKAQQVYQRDPKIQERAGVAYANYGGGTVPIDVIVARLETAVQRDPWGPYLLIALANRYLEIAGFAPPPTQIEPKMALNRVEQIYNKLRRIAQFSPLIDAVGAGLSFLRGDFCTSERLYRSVLAALPNDVTATTAFSAIQEFRKRDPDAFRDCPGS